MLSIITLMNQYVLAETEEENTCWVHKKIDPDNGDAPGLFEYDDDNGYCDGEGVNCEMIACDEYCNGIITAVPGGFTLELSLSSVSFKVKNLDGVWNTHNRSGANYTFNETHYIIIDQCPAFTNLENLKIELVGITTDLQGNYTVFIPSGSY